MIPCRSDVFLYNFGCSDSSQGLKTPGFSSPNWIKIIRGIISKDMAATEVRDRINFVLNKMFRQGNDDKGKTYVEPFLNYPGSMRVARSILKSAKEK